MEIVYRIRDWQTHFENNRTRELKYLEWVPVPNKHDGDGFTELMDHPNGTGHYGAWMLIVQVASKCDQRGTLLREGGRPYDAVSLARQTRASLAIIEEALPRLISVGWIEALPIDSVQVASNTASQCDIPAPPCGKVPTERNGTERNGSTAREREKEVPPLARSRPSSEEVLLQSAKIGLAEWRARDWFEEMEAVGWVDYHGRPVMKWSAMLNRVKAQWEADGKPMSKPPFKQRPQANAAAPGKKASSVYEISQAVKVMEEEAAKLKHKFYSEGNLGGSWTSQEGLNEFKKLRSKIKDLKAQIVASVA